MTYLRRFSITEPLSSFGEVFSVERTPIFELKSAIPSVSTLRNNVAVGGAGAVTTVSGEYLLACTAAGGDSAVLDSAEKGRYVPGYGSEAGIGVRIPVGQTYSGAQSARWGYYDGINGFGFGVDAIGTFVFIQRAGVETKTYQSDWNVDPANGAGPSGLTLDLTRGNIYQIRFTWYGYGTINFQVLIPDSTSAAGLQTVTVHRITPSAEISIQQPNQQVRVAIDNGGTAATQGLYVGGRQFSIIGSYDPNRRLTSEIRVGAPSGVGTTWVPIISFRRKTGIFNNQSVKLATIEALASGDAFLGVFTNVDLTGPSFGTPSDEVVTETVLESDVAATAISGGNLILRRLISGAANANSRSLNRVDAPAFDLTGTDPVTLAVRAVSGTITVNSALFELQEEW